MDSISLPQKISNNQSQVSGIISKQAEKCQINENINLKSTKDQNQLKRRRRGRPRTNQGMNYSPSSINFRQQKQRKLANIQAYQATLKKLRQQCKTFYWPFNESIKLNITDKERVIQGLKQARDYQKNWRETVRNVGVRHERNLFKYGVKQQLNFIINYLECGKLPRWMKQHFQQLLQKDFTKSDCNQYRPPMI